MVSVNKKHVLIFAVIAVVFLGMRLVGLGYDMSNSDAGRWHRRSENFLAAVKAGDFADTYQHYQPGITLMWINAAVKQIGFWYQMRVSPDAPATTENADWFPVIDGFSRAAVVVVLTGLLIFQMYAVRVLYGMKTAALFGLFVSVEPYLVGIDRWFHLTSLETYFSFSAFLAILVWERQGAKSRKLLAASAVLLSLAVLSKLTAIVAIFPITIVVLSNVLRDKNVKTMTAAILSKLVPFLSMPLKIFRTISLTFKVIGLLGFFSAVFLGVFFIVFPAMWVNPVVVWQHFHNAVTSAVGTDIRGQYFQGAMRWIYYLVILAFKLSPVTLLVFLPGIKDFKSHKFLYLYLAVFFTLLTISDKKIDRYVLEFFPPIILLASIFITDKLTQIRTTLVLGLTVIYTIWMIWTFHPMYSAYYSPLFGGAKAALKLGIFENSGEYFANTAYYLNQKGRNIKVYVPNNVEAFSYYFKGKITTEPDADIDYAVNSLDFDRPTPDVKQCKTMETAFGTYQMQYVYVFKCRN